MAKDPGWAYGVTTVPERRDNLLPRTLASLAAAGFDQPRLFVDGDKDWATWERLFPSLEITLHYPRIRTYGNWILSLAELFIRTPTAARFLMVQDDVLFVRNLRAYLNRCRFPEKGYWNLFTFFDNEPIIRGQPSGTWHEAREHKPGWQTGRGALALVFDRAAVITLLTHQHAIMRPLDANRGWRAVDGGVVESMNRAGYREILHCPSLVQHTGLESSMGTKRYPLALTFPGESFDALGLLPAKVNA